MSCDKINKKVVSKHISRHGAVITKNGGEFIGNGKHGVDNNRQAGAVNSGTFHGLYEAKGKIK